MASVPTSARVVVIGAGIVGNSLVYHLARLGWRDIVQLDKIVSATFAEEDGPAYQLVKNFTWTNEDQNVVAKYIAEDGMSSEEAAKKWVSENEDKVQAWLG